MKTLKKTLCLVLAVVMAVGVLILPANAAGYKDLSDKTEINENYAIAVETLTNMGIISGKASGTTTKFDPKGTLLRQEAAILLVNVMMKPSEKDILLAGYEDKNMFNDISGKDVYARREINYLASLGVVSGKDAELGLFKPHATLTTFELLTMLRKVAEIKNGYVTEDGEWTTQAVKFAVDYGAFSTKDLKARLFTNVDTDPNNTPTREETAQLIFNVITNNAKANITGTYTVTVKEGSDQKVFPNVTLEQAMMLSLTYGDKASIEADGVGGTSIGDLVYGLNIKATNTDVFMRPYDQYDNSGKGGDGKTIYKQFDPDPMLTFTSAGIVGMEALCKKLNIPTTGEDQVKQIGLRFFLDGTEITHDKFEDTTNGDYKIISTTDTTAIGNQVFSVAGESVEVYYSVNSNKIPCYYIVRISNIPHVIQNGEIADGKLTLEKKKHDASGVIIRNAVVVDAGDLAVGDVVVYHRSDKVAKKPVAYDVTPVVGVEGIITAKSISNDQYFRVGSNGGKDYLAALAVDAKNLSVTFDRHIAVKNSQIFYYYNGYVVAMKSLPNASASDYVYVLQYQSRVGDESGTVGNTDLLPSVQVTGPAAARAKILNPITGTVSVVDIAISYNTKDGKYYYTDVRGGISANHVGTIGVNDSCSFLGYHTFVKLTDGSYVLSDVGTDTASNDRVTIHEGRAQVTLDGNQVANNDTVVYLAKTTDGGKTYSVTKWTGYKNFKNVTSDDGALAILTPDGYIDTLFVLGEESVTPVNKWYVFTGCGEKYIEENGATLYNYNFLLDGQPVVYSCLDDGTTASTATHTKLEAALKDAGKDKVGSVYTLTFDVNGMLETAVCKDAASSSDRNYVVDKEVSQINDEFIVAGGQIYYLDAATVIYDRTPIGTNELEVGAHVSIYYMGGDVDVTTTPAALIVITKAAPDEFYQP